MKVVLGVDDVFFKPFNFGTKKSFFVKSYLAQEQKNKMAKT